MAQLILIVDFPEATADDLVQQVVLNDALDSSANGEEEGIAAAHVRPEHVMQMFMETSIRGVGAVGLYSGHIRYQILHDQDKWTIDGEGTDPTLSP